ncbi:WD40 repeat-like protein [Coniochaeta ligniaria NRRL 30616]|uniref:WD40 repeat-like protein n=1 Tax=Coniochaeta ligniaria NRRL 30616 TaxID=1408157 RepID=A0A1J7IXS9_9PEZI|nr:WD40 repeat-like protein [Coniochaeta ligniaria NRRL 30616]
MAFQMARANPTIAESIWQLSRLGPPIDTRNAKSIWHNIFTGCIFHKSLTQPHYWVIDALDEAIEGTPLDEYFMLLSKIDDSIPLKVFITSRPSISLDNLFAGLPTITESVTPDDSLADIRLYVETSSATLPVNDSQQRKTLVNDLVGKSGGSFLWTVLVMKQLRDPSVVTVEDVHAVLEKVPEKMSELYISNLKKLESSPTKTLAKHIITWALCSVRPLTVDQMKDAIKLSLDTTLSRDLRTSLQHLCGQFLDVDKQSQIQVIHETARAFLTMETLDSELRVDLPEGHKMIATACLKHLTSDELKYSKRRRSAVTINKLSIADYACLRFSEHILRASSSSDELFNLLTEFFNTNVLSWIECVVQLRDLDCLIRTARHLTRYLQRRSKHVPMIGGDLGTWAVDLPRIVTQFGLNLLSNPTAIHTLIPPFCPRNSAIFRHFGYAEDGIKLIGAWKAGWDDRIFSISYHDTYATAVAALDQRFVVGLADGRLKVYRTSTCEELTTLVHGMSVSMLQFGATSKLLASVGLRSLKLWDTVAGKEIFGIRTDSQILALAFNETESLILLASSDKHISARNTTDGSLLYRFAWTDTFVEKDGGHHLNPNAAKISIEQQVMAVVYRSKPVQLWCLEKQRPIGACLRHSSNLKHNNAGHIVHSVVLNPNPAYQRLVVSYWDDGLVSFDTTTCRPVVEITAGLDKIAMTPNGKTIAGGDGTGSIKIYDSETLQFLHRVPIQGDPLTCIVFTTDSLRIIDVRGTQSNVWEAAILVSQDSYSSASEPSDSVHQSIDDMEAPLVDQSSEITTLHCCEENGIAFCGRTDGRVDTCSLDDPEKTMRNLYKHRGSFTGITCFDWASKPRIAVSADSSGHFRVMQITTGTRREWSAQQVLEAKSEQGCAIRQVLVNSTGSLVLVSTSESDSLWSVPTKERIAHIKAPKRTTWKWIVRASKSSQLLLVEDSAVKLYEWTDLTQLNICEDTSISTVQGVSNSSVSHVDTDAISIASDGNELVFAQKVTRYEHGQQVITPGANRPTTRVHLFDLSTLEHVTAVQPTVTGSSVVPTADVADIPDVDYIIGTVKRFNAWCLLFISRKGWVCSVELRSGSVDTFQKHFFIPSVWRTGNSSFNAKVRRNQDIVFAHNDGVIVVKNGLDIGEYVSII